MAGKKTSADGGERVTEMRHDKKRVSIPPARLAAEGKTPAAKPVPYAFNPHLPPTLRFDPDGTPDGLAALLEAAATRPLKEEERARLAAALRQHEPWLEWTGKQEENRHRALAVDPVVLHEHERVSARAIVALARRQKAQDDLLGAQGDLFARPALPYHEVLKFYQHQADWTNRLILGDSLQVMASLAERENLAGQVQMIYIDPPYGIRFASNFQPELGRRDVKEKDEDLTREPEVVKAFRDTWTLGVHSYLSYLRARLLAAHRLLSETGSIFVQISDENLHRVRALMDEVFGAENAMGLIAFSKTSGATNVGLASTADYLVWYARDARRVHFRQVFITKSVGGEGGGQYTRIRLPDGSVRLLTGAERSGDDALERGSRVLRLDNLMSQSIGREKGEGAACWFPVRVGNRDFFPNDRSRCIRVRIAA